MRVLKKYWIATLLLVSVGAAFANPPKQEGLALEQVNLYLDTYVNNNLSRLAELNAHIRGLNPNAQPVTSEDLLTFFVYRKDLLEKYRSDFSVDVLEKRTEELLSDFSRKSTPLTAEQRRELDLAMIKELTQVAKYVSGGVACVATQKSPFSGTGDERVMQITCKRTAYFPDESSARGVSEESLLLNPQKPIYKYAITGKGTTFDAMMATYAELSKQFEHVFSQSKEVGAWAFDFVYKPSDNNTWNDQELLNLVQQQVNDSM